jgi:hypothetical protein
LASGFTFTIFLSQCRQEAAVEIVKQLPVAVEIVTGSIKMGTEERGMHTGVGPSGSGDRYLR